MSGFAKVLAQPLRLRFLAALIDPSIAMNIPAMCESPDESKI